MSKLLTFYTHTLQACGLVIDDDGLVSRCEVEGAPSRPITIEGKRLTLPNDYYLTTENVEGLIPFHPLSENIARGQSPVLKFLVKQCRVNLTVKIVSLATQLITIATHKEYQNRLPSVWDDFFRKVPQTDDKTEANFTKMMNEVLNHSSGTVSLFLKNGGKIDGVEYLRTCVVNFKLIDEIKSRAPYGVTIRKKDADMFLEIFRFILPDIETPDAYTVGVNYDTAPYFTALMKAYGNLATALNEKILLLSAVDKDANEKIPTSYMKEMDGLSSLRKVLPPLDGNEGANVKGEKEAAKEEVKTEEEVPVKVSKASDNPPWEEEKEEVPISKAAREDDTRRSARGRGRDIPVSRRGAARSTERGGRTQSFRGGRDDYDDTSRNSARSDRGTRTQSFRDLNMDRREPPRGGRMRDVSRGSRGSSRGRGRTSFRR